MIEKYYLPDHPEVRITFKVPNTDQEKYNMVMNKRLATKPKANDAPDIVALEATFLRGHVGNVNLGDLADVGLTEEDYADLYPLIVEAGRSNSGVQKAISWQACPNVLFYRASLAEEYLGVTSPEQFREMVKDNPSFLETAAKLFEASQGTCRMVMGSGDLRSMGEFELYSDNGNKEMDLLALIAKMRDYSFRFNAWTKEWYKGMYGELKTLCYIFPMWGLRKYLMPKCGKKTNERMTDEQLKASSEKTGGTYGDWRVVPAPEKNIRGGTWLAVNAAKIESADEAKKAAIKNLFKFLMDPAFQAQYALDTHEFVSNRKAVQQIIESGEVSYGFLGGQDPYPVMDEVMKDLHFR